MTRLALLVVLALVAGDDWKRAVPDYSWSFPRDHWAHDGYRTEWWYFTGLLASEDDPDRRFGYQFTFFRVGLLTEPPPLDSAWSATHAVMGHAAVSDLARGEHVFSEVFYRQTEHLARFNAFPDPRIGWSLGPAGTDGKWTLDWNGEGFDVTAEDDALGLSFALSTRPLKPLVFQGPEGYSRKGFEEGAASQYYSFTRLATEGELRFGGERFRVRGTSWMDKEFSSSHLGEKQVGWDWFSLRLEDGRDLMLYVMRREDGRVDYASGTLVSPAGETSFLAREDFEIAEESHWTSPETGARYPTSWRVTLAPEGLALEVRALLDGQENRSRLPGGVYYWEGAVSVSGDVSGEGYVELTGYGEGNRPPV